MSAVRGLVAAMAMSGMRQVTTRLGLLPRTPPEQVAEDEAPRLLARVSPERRAAVVELAHWEFGLAFGAAWTLVPAAIRRQPWAGPAYGLVVWQGFLLTAPLLGVGTPQDRTPSAVGALALDHLLFGAIVGREGVPAVEEE